MTEFTLRTLTIDDYDVVYALWQSTPGIGLSDSDRRDAIEAFLSRNRDLSAVAVNAEGNVVGTVLCGHDGRRGYLHHLAVLPQFRHRGIAKRLVIGCIERLRNERIQKCNIFLFRSNVSGAAFWIHNGWNVRDDLNVLQYVVLDSV
jgi:N-acetylglutamate synthase